MQKLTLKLCAAFCFVIILIHIFGLLFPANAKAFGFAEPLWYTILSCIFPLFLALWILYIGRRNGK